MHIYYKRTQLLFTSFTVSATNSNPATGLFSFRNVDDLEILNAIFRVKSMAIGLTEARSNFLYSSYH
jgi:hypothetical protein